MTVRIFVTRGRAASPLNATRLGAGVAGLKRLLDVRDLAAYGVAGVSFSISQTAKVIAIAYVGAGVNKARGFSALATGRRVFLEVGGGLTSAGRHGPHRRVSGDLGSFDECFAP